jgi:hypothetical protein
MPLVHAPAATQETFSPRAQHSGVAALQGGNPRVSIDPASVTRPHAVPPSDGDPPPEPLPASPPDPPEPPLLAPRLASWTCVLEEPQAAATTAPTALSSNEMQIRARFISIVLRI